MNKLIQQTNEVLFHSGPTPWLLIVAMSFIVVGAILCEEYNAYARKTGLEVFDHHFFDQGENSRQFLKIMCLSASPDKGLRMRVVIWVNRCLAAAFLILAVASLMHSGL